MSVCSPYFTLVGGIHGCVWFTVELLGELVRVGERTNHTKLVWTMDISHYGHVEVFLATVCAPYLYTQQLTIPHLYIQQLTIPHLYTQQLTIPHLYTQQLNIPHLYTQQLTIPHLYTQQLTIPHLYTQQLTMPHLYKAMNYHKCSVNKHPFRKRYRSSYQR